MKACYTTFFILLLYYCAPVYAQSGGSKNSDCVGLVQLQANQVFSAPVGPKGYGNILEFVGNEKDSKYFFEKEHNTSWYFFKVPNDGTLTFEVMPMNPKDDFDWLLYKFTGTNFCNDVISKSVLPIRSNISRNDLSIQSKTGLKVGFNDEFVRSGIGASYSKAIEVKQGTIYLLILDNVYDKNSAGHKILVSVTAPPAKPIAPPKPPVKIKGIVTLKSNNIPVDAELIVEDIQTGSFVSSTVSDPKTGEYSFSLPPTKNYSITAVKEGYVFASKNVIFKKPKPDSLTIVDLSIDTIRVGAKMTFNNIQFEPNSSTIKENSKADLNRLMAFMEKSDAIIEVRGHSNANKFSDKTYLRYLSTQRAKAVSDYLISNNISEYRIYHRGMGGSEPLIISDKVEEAIINLRVEVLLLDRLE